MTNIFHQRGLGDFDEWPLLRFEPTGKVQQVVGVDAQRAKRELPDALTVQESVRPGQFGTCQENCVSTYEKFSCGFLKA